jgi:protein-S-isoprenylcysteine O-methyltransferase Ste14
VLAAVASAIFVVVAPGFVAAVGRWWISHWRFDRLGPREILGATVIAQGIVLLLGCVQQFVNRGLGTPAPVFPTQHLVVAGFYGIVRNPMYLAVVAIILGQALMFRRLALLEYGAAAWLVFHLFVLVYEEPTLRSTFGAEYDSFGAKVPRRIPSFKNRP